MKVVDFFKKKSEVLAQHQFDFTELKERIPPLLLEHWAELLSKANNTQIVNWAREHQFTSLGNTAEPIPNEAALTLPKEGQKLLNELSSQLHQEIHVGEWLAISQERIDQFAAVTNDDQWIHTDPVRSAQESPFKSTVAHGFLTLSLLPVLTGNTNTTSASDFSGARMTVNCGLNEVRFLYPVKVNSRIRARTTLLAVNPIKRNLEVVKEVRIETEGTNRLVCIAQSVIRLYF